MSTKIPKGGGGSTAGPRSNLPTLLSKYGGYITVRVCNARPEDDLHTGLTVVNHTSDIRAFDISIILQGRRFRGEITL